MKEEVDVLVSPSLIVLPVSVDVKQQDEEKEVEVAKTWFVLGAGQAKTLMPTLHTLTGTKGVHNRQKWPNLRFQQVKAPGSLRYSKRVCNR